MDMIRKKSLLNVDDEGAGAGGGAAKFCCVTIEVT